MKLFALLAAGALVAGSLAVAPAEAQRYGYHGHHGYSGGLRYRGYPHRYWGPRGGYGLRGYHGRPRVVCRWHRDRYGAVRRCTRFY